MKPLTLVGVLCVVVCAGLCFAPQSATSAEPVDYEKSIKPLLVQRCVDCHGPDDQNADLRLDSVAGGLRGGNSGPAIVPGKSSESLLLKAVLHADGVQPMPPEEDKLSDAEIALLRNWIDQGAIGPKDEVVVEAARPKSTHWAFQPLGEAQPPAVKNSAWVRNPIDAFILAKLETVPLRQSPEADRPTLIRRLSLDLLGIPPTPKEVDAFVADTSDQAYEKLVDRLLASPHYGERWGRHWLDEARYADSNGYTIDSGRSIWKYRDWVIDALNRDLPFDQFTIEQLAGDMLPKATQEQIVATGFHRNTLRNEEGGTDAEQFRVEAVADRVATTGSVFLGLTIGCARCHDHKYDPISQREFYQVFAVFNNVEEETLTLPTNQQARERPALLAEIESIKQRLKEFEVSSVERQRQWEEELTAQLKALEASGNASEVLELVDQVRDALAVKPDKRTDKQKQLLTKAYNAQDPVRRMLDNQLAELRVQLKQLDAAITSTLVMSEISEPRETFVHVRGDFLRHGARVEPGTLGVLPPLEPTGPQANRLDFARWLVEPDNPLTPRVTMNRVWQRYFGAGLVATENDFGTQGDPPTHPELLDWLAREFIARGWSLKAMHRLIVTSATYRQSSAMRADVLKVDPYNKLLARQSRLRLEAEIIRDSALAASGLLTREIGGPSVYPPQPEGIYRFTQQKKYWKESQGEDRFRRTMYTYFWRSSPYPFLVTFDAPDSNNTCTRRVRSNTPLQALTMANDRSFFELAQGLAARTLREAKDDDARLRLAFRLCLARDPSQAELSRLEGYLQSQRDAFAKIDAEQAAAAAPAQPPSDTTAAEGAAWTAVARVLLNLDEFVTRE